MQAKFYLENLKATQKWGEQIGQIIQPETVIALSGQLGSGKTTLTQAIAKGLQIEELVVSPTFVMINEYHTGRLPMYHLDLYRFLDPCNQFPDHSNKFSDQSNPFSDQSASKEMPVGARLAEPSMGFLISQLEEILQTKAVVIIEWASVLFDQFALDLNSLCQSGYLSLNLQSHPDNDQARTVTMRSTMSSNKKDERCQLLFSDLYELSKKLLSK